MKTSFIMTGTGNVTLVHEGGTYQIGTDHARYDQIVDCLKAGNYTDLNDHLDLVAIVQSNMDGVLVDGTGLVTYKGEPMHSLVTERITQFVREGLPFNGLVAFLGRIMKNPSGRSVNELYGFLEKNGLTITDDGMVIAYKGVREDWTDCHSGTIDNSIGQSPRFERNRVDDDCRNSCSFGLHVGSYEYARGFATNGGHLVVIKFDPADAVAVPYDDANKIRVAGYTVIAECEEKLTQTVYEPPVEREEIVGAFVEAREEILNEEVDDYDCDFCEDDGCEECDDSLDESDVEKSTGRIRGLLGRFLPGN